MEMNKAFQLVFFCAMLMFASCATVRTDSSERDITYHNRTNIVNYGAEHAEIIGPVLWEENAKCSKISFLAFAISRNPNIDDIINIVMEEHKNTMTRSVRCKYSGLAVSYETLSVEEAAKWHDIGDSALFVKDKGTGKEQKVETPIGAYIWAGIASVAATVFIILFVND